MSVVGKPAGLPYRPPRVTPKPRVPGSQTAVVCGPKGQEVFTDRYGRVKVQFHWDREGKYDGDSSCWVRVATTWAGRRWGATHVPRVGQEVVVDFLEGDPDRPIVVGSVFNADQMPPYLGDGPDGRHRNDPKVSGVKSNSTPDCKGYNELRFDDTKGREQVFIHAQGNHDLRVNASSMTSVGGSAHLTVGHEKDGKKSGDLRRHVFHDFHHHVGNDEVRWVERDRHDTVARNLIEEVINGGRYSAVPNGNVVQHGRAVFVTSDTDLVLQAANLYLNAASMIQLTVGGNLVTIDATGVTIFGTLTKVNCPGSVARPVPPADGILAGSNTLKPDDPDPAAQPRRFRGRRMTRPAPRSDPPHTRTDHERSCPPDRRVGPRRRPRRGHVPRGQRRPGAGLRHRRRLPRRRAAARPGPTA